MGSILAKRYQQIRNGTTSCSEIRHQQTWQPLTIVLQACYIPPLLEIPGNPQERSSLVYAFQDQTWTSRHQQIRQIGRVSRTLIMPDWATATSSHNQSVITGRIYSSRFSREQSGTGTDYIQTLRQQCRLGLLSLKWLHTLPKFFLCF